MDVHDLVLPKMFANVRMSLWLPGAWPGLHELMDGDRRAPDGRGVDRYLEQRHQCIERVRAALRAGARVPLMDGDLVLGFWHQRGAYAERDRTRYAHTAESFILPALQYTGAFRESAVRAVTHLFDTVAPEAAGIYLFVSEYPVAEAQPDPTVLTGALLGRKHVTVSSGARRRRRASPHQLAFGFGPAAR
jgi:hypothetical protein